MKWKNCSEFVLNNQEVQTYLPTTIKKRDSFKFVPYNDSHFNSTYKKNRKRYYKFYPKK